MLGLLKSKAGKIKKNVYFSLVGWMDGADIKKKEIDFYIQFIT